MLRVSTRLIYFKSKHFHKKLFCAKIVLSTILHRPSTNHPVRFELFCSLCFTNEEVEGQRVLVNFPKVTESRLELGLEGSG